MPKDRKNALTGVLTGVRLVKKRSNIAIDSK